MFSHHHMNITVLRLKYPRGTSWVSFGCFWRLVVLIRCTIASGHCITISPIVTRYLFRTAQLVWVWYSLELQRATVTVRHQQTSDINKLSSSPFCTFTVRHQQTFIVAGQSITRWHTFVCHRWTVTPWYCWHQREGGARWTIYEILSSHKDSEPTTDESDHSTKYDLIGGITSLMAAYYVFDIVYSWIKAMDRPVRYSMYIKNAHL